MNCIVNMQNVELALSFVCWLHLMGTILFIFSSSADTGHCCATSGHNWMGWAYRDSLHSLNIRLAIHVQQTIDTSLVKARPMLTKQLGTTTLLWPSVYFRPDNCLFVPSSLHVRNIDFWQNITTLFLPLIQRTPLPSTSSLTSPCAVTIWLTWASTTMDCKRGYNPCLTHTPIIGESPPTNMGR